MEADLQMFHRVDYRDRWRGDLTLRRISVLVRHLPPESAVGTMERHGKPFWTLTDHLLDDLRMSLVGSKRHPAKPHPTRPGAQRSLDPRRIEDGRRRRRQRLQSIEAGRIT